jgi:hypothetical protein
MRPDAIVVTTPVFDHDTCLVSPAKTLQRQALVAELTVEALIGPPCQGFLGSISAVSMPIELSQVSRHLDFRCVGKR